MLGRGQLREELAAHFAQSGTPLLVALVREAPEEVVEFARGFIVPDVVLFIVKRTWRPSLIGCGSMIGTFAIAIDARTAINALVSGSIVTAALRLAWLNRADPAEDE